MWVGRVGSFCENCWKHTFNISTRKLIFRTLHMRYQTYSHHRITLLVTARQWVTKLMFSVVCVCLFTGLPTIQSSNSTPSPYRVLAHSPLYRAWPWPTLHRASVPGPPRQVQTCSGWTSLHRNPLDMFKLVHHVVRTVRKVGSWNLTEISSISFIFFV